ncbi:MAG: efflux RND transporter periplasmic adaptor subunit [Rikenellaceae bacterium]|nr:efflux RND transporter periplasmic adaptor subunit [Rikenellaceae bacterium]
MKRAFVLLLATVTIAACDGTNNKDKENSNLAREEQRIQPNKVDATVLNLRPFNKELISNGRLEARRKALLSFRSSGEIAAVNVLPGAKVAAGAVIASLDRREAEATLASARLSMRKAEMELADKLAGFDYAGVDTTKIPRETMDIAYIRSGYLDARQALANAQRNYDGCVIKAPFAGKIANIKQSTHERASGDFCTLLDDGAFNVKFTILETELAFVSVGQKVSVSPFNSPDVKVDGRIKAINPTVAANGQIEITAEIPNAAELIDGMNVKVTMQREVENQMVVPRSAVVIRDNLEVLFRYSKGRSVWTYVRIDMANSHQYVVRANTERGAELNVGDTVIISGNLNLGGDTEVEITNIQ